MAAPENIIKLVDAFESNYDTYKSFSYNEENIKMDFINPLFEALGWDIGNKTNKPPELREEIKIVEGHANTALEA